jgi:hypothetical protein
MSMLGKAFETLRAWLGLADASESHLTPSHGWLLPVPVDARVQRDELAPRRAVRLRSGDSQA